MKSDKKPSLKEIDALATKYAKKQMALFENYEALAEDLLNELEAKIAKWPESAKNMVLELQSSKFDKMMDQKDNSEVEDSSSENEPSLGEAETLATEYAEKQLALFNNYEELADKLDEELEALAAEWPESAQTKLVTLQASKFTKMLNRKTEDEDDDEENEEDDDKKGCGSLIAKFVLIVIAVCAAYFTRPSDAYIKDKVEQEVTTLYFKDRPTPTITYDIDDFFVFKITSYCAENDDRVYAGRAIALFGFVWVP